MVTVNYGSVLKRRGQAELLWKEDLLLLIKMVEGCIAFCGIQLFMLTAMNPILVMEAEKTFCSNAMIILLLLG